MEQLVNTLNLLLAGIVGTVGDFVTLILGNPYLLFGVSLMLIGAGVSFLKRLIRV